MKIDGHDLAFPYDQENYGLTKREYFASMALQGFISGVMSGECDACLGDISHDAVLFADELIKALNE